MADIQKTTVGDRIRKLLLFGLPIGAALWLYCNPEKETGRPPKRDSPPQIGNATLDTRISNSYSDEQLLGVYRQKQRMRLSESDRGKLGDLLTKQVWEQHKVEQQTRSILYGGLVGIKLYFDPELRILQGYHLIHFKKDPYLYRTATGEQAFFHGYPSYFNNETGKYDVLGLWGRVRDLDAKPNQAKIERLEKRLEGLKRMQGNLENFLSGLQPSLTDEEISVSLENRFSSLAIFIISGAYQDEWLSSLDYPALVELRDARRIPPPTSPNLKIKKTSYQGLLDVRDILQIVISMYSDAIPQNK